MSKLPGLMLVLIFLSGCAGGPQARLSKATNVLLVNASRKSMPEVRDCFKTSILSSNYILRSWDNFVNCAKTIPDISYYIGKAWYDPKYDDFITAAKEEGFRYASATKSFFMPDTYADVKVKDPEEAQPAYKLIGDDWLVLESFPGYIDREYYRN